MGGEGRGTYDDVGDEEGDEGGFGEGRDGEGRVGEVDKRTEGIVCDVLAQSQRHRIIKRMDRRVGLYIGASGP